VPIPLSFLLFFVIPAKAGIYPPPRADSSFFQADR
jgi:hypothetical protein